MSIRPIDLQVAISKSQELGKSAQISNDKFILQDAFKHEMQKTAEKHSTEVNEAEELDKLVHDDEHKDNSTDDNHEKNKEEAEKRKAEQLRKKAEEEQAEFKRKVTNRGNLFDFKA